jgi:hypothetical protein
MVQLKLISQTDKATGDRRIGDKIKSGPSPVASRSASVKSVASAMEAWKNSSRLGPTPVAAPIEPPKVTPASETKLTLPGLVFTPGLKLLIAALILVALVPSVILGAILWFGTAPAPQATTPAPSAQSNLSPVLTTPATIEASAGEELGFPIALDGTDGVPPRSIIAIAGLPKGSTFSDGRPYGEAEWNLRSDQIGDLRLILPASASGDSKLSIRLIAPDDTMIADAETMLKVSPPTPKEAAPADADIVTGSIADNTGAAAPPAPVEAAMAPEAATPVPPQESVAPPSPKPAQAAKPEQTGTPGEPAPEPAAGDASADSVQVADFVNLRDAPSSSSRIMGVVAKGAKLKVSDRKRGWLQVTNPETSEQGWIYGGYVEGASKSSRVRRASRLAAPATQPEQKSDGFWSSVGKWFSSE